VRCNACVQDAPQIFKLDDDGNVTLNFSVFHIDPETNTLFPGPISNSVDKKDVISIQGITTLDEHSLQGGEESANRCPRGAIIFSIESIN